MNVSRWLGPLPGLKEGRAIAIMALVVGAILCGVSLLRGFRGEAFMGRPVGGDFAQFYVVGKVLNEYPADRIYDLNLTFRLYRENVPAAYEHEVLLFANAPWIAPLFRPFAMLSYRWAYVAWLGFSLVVYVAGLLLIRPPGLTRAAAGTALLMALSWPSYLFETWIGGQLSVVSFLALAGFVYCRRRGWLFWAGVSLSMAAMKPTLVVVSMLMLLLFQKWPSIFGGIAGFGGTTLASFASVGRRGVEEWLRTLGVYREIATTASEAMHREKYVDWNAFWHLLMREWPSFAFGMGLLCALATLALLVWFCLRRGESDVAWAAIFTATLLINIYVPIYDTLLLTAVIALLIPHRHRFEAGQLPLWILLLYLAPWVTQNIASFLRIQVFTLLLAGFLIWQLRELPRQRC